MSDNAISIPATDLKKLSGEEKIITCEGEEISTLKDFWSWAYSDILGNTERGAIAEYLVACALGINKGVRISWDKYDLLFTEEDREIAIEVKSSGYLQTWEQKKESKLIFGIQKTLAWDYTTDVYEEEKKRQSDIYVFCIFNSKEMDKANTLDLSQWEFYLLPTAVIDKELGDQKTVSLNVLKKIGAEECPFENLSKKIKELVSGGRK